MALTLCQFFRIKIPTLKGDVTNMPVASSCAIWVKLLSAIVDLQKLLKTGFEFYKFTAMVETHRMFCITLGNQAH